MNCVSIAIVLQAKHCWTGVIIRISFKLNCLNHTLNGIEKHDAVFSEALVGVSSDCAVAGRNQPPDLVQQTAHSAASLALVLRPSSPFKNFAV